MLLTKDLIGKVAVLQDGHAVKIIDVGTRIKVQNLDGQIKECYYTDVRFLWEN
jgi:hypothetical protein